MAPENMPKSGAVGLPLVKRLQGDLETLCGGPWKFISCESQATFNVMVIWVLLYEDSDLNETHAALGGVLARHVDDMKPLEAAISYEMFTDDGYVSVRRVKGNAAALAPLKACPFRVSDQRLPSEPLSNFPPDSKRR